jgi:hypothetical protein
MTEQEQAHSPSAAPPPEEWNTAVQVLRDLLASSGGAVSSYALREALEKKGIKDARGLVVSLRYYDFDASPEDGRSRPDVRWYGHAKSFYTEERFAKLQRKTEEKATDAEQQVAAAPSEAEGDDEDEAAPPRERRRNRQEERRLGTYVVSALENIYQSEHTPDDASYVFDVHSDRAGTDYENVDVLAIHWRSPKVAELVSVEVKLDFSARLVQQARNYTRFSDRVWVAAPLLAEAADASAALRDFDPQLFEHVVESGLGILACRRRPGRSYEVVPVHWPRRLDPDPVEREGFLERYRKAFEQAGVLAPRAGRRNPVFG